MMLRSRRERDRTVDDRRSTPVGHGKSSIVGRPSSFWSSRKRWRPRVESFLALYAPLSKVSLPLINGLARRRLLHGGAREAEARLRGMSINYYCRQPPVANAMPVVLVHGIADNALTWSFVFGPLARDYPVYALDLPGYGLSGLPDARGYTTLDEMRDVLVDFMREVVGRPALVVGNSMGGWLAVKLAWAAPELVRGVVLLDAGGAPLNGRDSWGPFGEAIGMQDLRSARLAFKQMFGAIPAPLLYLGQQSLQDLFQRKVVRGFISSLVAVEDPEEVLLRARDLRELPVPAGLIWGLNDRFLPAGSLEFFRDNMPRAEKLFLARCGHLPQRERPRSVVRFVRQFAVQLERAELMAVEGGVGEGRRSSPTPPSPYQ
jgi:pimeloyl-ACP methyl ester carboxylesterase